MHGVWPPCKPGTLVHERPFLVAGHRTAATQGMLTEHSHSSPIASRSNNPVNCDPGSAHGTRICFTPWASQSIRGTSASIHVVN